MVRGKIEPLSEKQAEIQKEVNENSADFSSDDIMAEVYDDEVAEEVAQKEQASLEQLQDMAEDISEPEFIGEGFDKFVKAFDNVIKGEVFWKSKYPFKPKLRDIAKKYFGGGTGKSITVENFELLKQYVIGLSEVFALFDKDGETEDVALTSTVLLRNEQDPPESLTLKDMCGGALAPHHVAMLKAYVQSVVDGNSSWEDLLGVPVVEAQDEPEDDSPF